MFITLMLATLAISALVSFLVVRLFDKPVATILNRIVSSELSPAWQKYLRFAIYVVGISGGVRIWDLEKYISPQGGDTVPLVLTSERWMLEIYRTLLETLQSIAWMLLVFFVFALIAYVVVRAFELRQSKAEKS
jgi:predicted Kef-type K+ transport protein